MEKGNKPRDISEILRENEYPGRGIVIGKSSDGKSAVFAYFIMGRSENSRNRVFVKTGDGIRTQAHDPSKMTDPSLIIYSPVRKAAGQTVVTNGDQTDTVCEFLSRGGSFEAALETRCFEPDEPNFTPRVSGLLDFGGEFSYKLSILKSADTNGGGCNRFTFSYAPINGLGHFIHTYDGNGNPIPSFSGEPEAVFIDRDIDAFSELLWSSLNADNKVSLYVSYTDLTTGAEETRVINKNNQEGKTDEGI